MWFRRALFVSFMFVVLLANAQNGKRVITKIDDNINNTTSSCQFIKIHETLNLTNDVTKEGAILKLLQRRNIFSSNESSALNLTHQIKSLAGEHFTFAQTYNGIPIYGATIKINIDNDNIVRTILSNLKINYTTENTSVLNDFLEPTSIAKNYIETTLKQGIARNSEWNYFINTNNELSLIVKTNVFISDTNYNKEVLLGVNGQLIKERDLNVYYKLPFQDSLVSAKIYLPDPLTTAGVNYGIPYVDSSNKNTAVLDVQRQIVTMSVDFQNDTFYLRNSFISLRDIAFPNFPIVFVLNPDFNFTRDSSAFEDVNTYYHIKKFQDYVRYLGFFSISDALVRIDPHGTSADQSWYSAPNTLIFGDGGVDDAEDADVIVHEYGHALSGFASPGTNVGTQREALDEGLGDYIAASYSRGLNNYNWEKVFTWDGHNEFWNGRDAASNKHYPENLGNGIHLDGEIWASSLMDIWGDIGKEITDRIVIQSIYSWSNGMSMVDAADLVVEADSLLYFGANHDIILTRFVERGFYIDSSGTPNPEPFPPTDTPITELVITNTQGFLQGIGDLQIAFPDSMIFGNIKVDIFDITGRLIISMPQQLIQNNYAISTNIALARGIYFIRIYDDKTGKILKTEKIVK